jgi:hypothetical protein
MEAVEARIMMTQIVRTLHKGGMTVFDSYDISRYKGEKPSSDDLSEINSQLAQAG